MWHRKHPQGHLRRYTFPSNSSISVQQMYYTNQLSSFLGWNFSIASSALHSLSVFTAFAVPWMVLGQGKSYSIKIGQQLNLNFSCTACYNGFEYTLCSHVLRLTQSGCLPWCRKLLGLYTDRELGLSHYLHVMVCAVYGCVPCFPGIHTPVKMCSTYFVYRRFCWCWWIEDTLQIYVLQPL